MKLKKLLKISLSLFIFGISFFNIPQKTSAESNDFIHTVNANYAIREDKSASVEFKFTTTNKISNNYLQVFSLKLPFEPKNISTAGSETPISLKSVNPIQNNFYEIEIEILQPVYGAEKEFNWSFSFEITEIIFEHGMQKVVFFPTFSEDRNINDYTINVNIPDSLGEIRYIYGNTVSEKAAYSTNISYKKQDNNTSSFSILLGPEQEYFLETNTLSQESDILLPKNIPFQEVFYTQFPKREVDNLENIDSTVFKLKPNEKIQAFINTYNTYDKIYIKSFEEISNKELVNEINQEVRIKNSNYEVARRVYNYLFTRYNTYDYFTTIDTIVDLSNKNKTLLNPAELNKIFREVLTSLNIENRGVYGYVFPAQPFKKDAFATEQHVWSEFWDGSKWIVVDPTWFIASRGADYFDKNSFHHVKFGSYSTFEELKRFLSSSNSLKVSPLTARQNQKRSLDIKIDTDDTNVLNKKLNVILTNNSNQPVTFKDLNISISNLTKVKFLDPKVNLNKTIYPNTTVKIPINFDYGLLLKKQDGTLKTELNYSEIGKDESILKIDQRNINFNSNISSYLTEIIILIVLIFLIISISSFVIYKKMDFFGKKNS